MAYRRKKNRKLEPLGSILPGVMKTVQPHGQGRLVEIWQLWESAVGEVVAKNAQPSAFKGKLLLVEVSSSSWMQQLQFLKTELINKINLALGEALVDDITFKIGSL
jgi:predicted nucleic acid-binding Zn ribbon protein